MHSLEHGAVWTTYREGLAADQVQHLQQAVSGHDYTLMSPYPDLRAPVVTAWNAQLNLDSPTDPRLVKFIQKYAERHRPGDRRVAQRGVRRDDLMQLRWLSVPVLLAAGTVLGLSLSWPPGEGSPDVRFARDMSAHHTQAVTMSDMVLRRAQDPAVQLLARDMMLTQEAQADQMSGWLMAWAAVLH